MKIIHIILILLLFSFAGTQIYAQSTQARDYSKQTPGDVRELRTSNPSTNIEPARALERIHYYQNTYGSTIQAPTQYNKAPQSATAVCRDGSYSFSRSRSGTCSHHGGVARWL